MSASAILKVEKRTDAWWIVGGPYGISDMGAYDTKSEADEDRRGVERWIRDNKKWLEKEFGVNGEKTKSAPVAEEATKSLKIPTKMKQVRKRKAS